ncbi:hypothetical protein X975_18016, partial [Stegodyphus mimosarum]
MRILLLSLFSCILVPNAQSLSCPSGKLTFVRRLFSKLKLDSLPAGDVIQVHESPPSECFALCMQDDSCSAYVIDYKNSSCLIVHNITTAELENELVQDGYSSYHRKLCLPDTLCKHEWEFDEVQGVQLFHYLDKIITNINSSDLCMSLCLSEPTFTCRSARFNQTNYECILSQHDRRTAAEVFRQSPKPGSVLYLERQCVEEPTGCQFRSRQSRAVLRRHRHVQVIENITTREQCEISCLHTAPFLCRSYEFDGENCILSPEDSASEFGPLEQPVKAFEETSEVDTGAVYFEKESCVDVDVQCGATAMKAVVRVSTPFRGRVYAAGHPYDCYSVTVTDDGHVTLSIPLHGRQCGTKNLGNGTFTNVVVVQHHPFVLRTSDRRIDVACDYEEMKLKIRGSKSVKHGELKPLAHTVTAVAPTPPIRLRVVNASNQDVKGVELGDPLFLKVELADESVYGIFGSDLVARSSAGSETVLLIDDDGCPVEPTVIQALDRLPGSKSLVAPFQAFKFASDSAVKFQMTVSYCLDTCPPADCEVPRSSHTRSYGKKRRRRRSAAQFFDILPGDVVTDVTMESPMFLVNNLKPTLDDEQAGPGGRWEPQFQFQDHSEGHIRIKAQTQGMCVSMTTLYVIGAVIGAIQLVIIFACAVFFFYRSDCHAKEKSCSTSTRSWPSVSSRRKLVCNQS